MTGANTPAPAGRRAARLRRSHRLWLSTLLFALAALSCAPVFAGSTVNPAIPANNADLTSAPIRQNFDAAYNDINNIEGMFSGVSPPASPTIGQDWLNKTGIPWVWNKWDGAAWVEIGTYNSTTHTVSALAASLATTGNMTVGGQLLLAGGGNFYAAPAYPYAGGIAGATLTYQGPGVTDPTNYTETDIASGKQYVILNGAARNDGPGTFWYDHIEVQCGPDVGTAASDCARGISVGAQNQGPGALKSIGANSLGRYDYGPASGVLVTGNWEIGPTSATTFAAAGQFSLDPGVWGGVVGGLPMAYNGVASIFGDPSGCNRTLTTSAQTNNASPVLTFTSTSECSGSDYPAPGDLVEIGTAYFAAGTTVVSATATTVTVSSNALENVPSSTSVTFGRGWLYGFVPAQDAPVKQDWLHFTMDPSFGPSARVLRVNGLQQNGAPIEAELDSLYRFRTSAGLYSGNDFNSLVMCQGCLNGGTPTIAEQTVGGDLFVQSGGGTGVLYLVGGALAAIQSSSGSEATFGGGATIGTPTGGPQGLGTLNLAGALYNNGTAPTGTGAYLRATSPALAGIPTAPTASPGTNTTQVATTAYALANSANSVSNSDGTLTISPDTGAVVASLALGHANIWTGQQTFGAVQGGIGNSGSPVSGTTYSFAATDCGKTVVFTSSSAVTATIPASIVPASTVCVIAVLQAGTAKVSVNGSAVTPATLISAGSYTGTSGTAGAMIGLTLVTVSSATDAFLTGNGS